MNFQKYKFLYPIIFTIASIFLSFLLWDKIVLEYSNPHEIVGEYAANSHSVYNDSLRFLVFTFLPVLTFLVLFLYSKDKKKFSKLSLDLFKINSTKKENYFSKIKLCFAIFVLIITFLFSDWNNFNFSIFEEGMPLSGATNFNLGLMPWVDIFLNTGFFHDMINAKVSWKLSGYQTIGSYKFFIILLNLISNILILYLIYLLTSQIKEKKIRDLFFISTSIILLYTLKNAVLWKDIPTIIFLIYILKYLNFKNNFYITSICFITLFSFFWSLDKGFFIFFTFVPFLFLIFLNNKKEFIKFLFILIFFLILIVSVVKIEILIEFLNHSKEIFSQHEVINGIIHPTPFSDQPNSTRASKTLLLIIINFILTILITFKKEDYFKNNTKLFFIFFSIFNFLVYKSALSRSDGGHIQMASYFSIILFIFYFNFFILNFLSNKKKYKLINKNRDYIFYIFLFIFLLTNIHFKANSYKFFYKIEKYVKAGDDKFISKKYKNSLEKLNLSFKEEDCLFLFSYDQAIFYLLQKKSCSKFSNVWVVGSKKNQLKYIEELKRKKTKYILKGGNVSFQGLSERYPYIENFIQKEYSLFKEIDFWEIYKKK
jgi:hypothetical protein